MRAFGVANQRPTTAIDVAKHLDVLRIEHRGLPAHKVGRLSKFKLTEVYAWVRAGGAAAEDSAKGGR